MKRIKKPMQNENDIQKIVGRNTGFTIPEDYFTQLSASILANTVDKKSAKYRRMHTWQIASAIAALFVVFFGVKSIYQPQSSELSREAIATYLLDEAYFELEEDWVVEAYLSSYTETTSNELDFLLNNDIDLNSIINEYNTFEL